jgi:hypothetical protein
MSRSIASWIKWLSSTDFSFSARERAWRRSARLSLRHIQRALEKKRDGKVTLALVHLAVSGVAKLRDPKEDARRLFLADALMSDALTTDLAQHCARHLPNGDDRHSRRG